MTISKKDGSDIAPRMKAGAAFVASGQLVEAAEIYAGVMTDYFPRDAPAFRNAYALTRDGDRSMASRAYAAIAEGWRAEGRYLKAAPMFRIAIALDPTRRDLARILAEMYVALGLPGEEGA